MKIVSGRKTFSKKNSQFFTSDPSGFTLIELLVVIAIIGILSAVVMLAINPAKILRETRDAARQTGIKYLQDALERYLLENDSYPMPTQYVTANYNYEYIKSTWEGSGGYPTVEQQLQDADALAQAFIEKPTDSSHTWSYIRNPHWQYMVWKSSPPAGCSIDRNYRILIELESWSESEINSLPNLGYGCNYKHTCYWYIGYNIAYCYIFPGQLFPKKSEL